MFVTFVPLRVWVVVFTRCFRVSTPFSSSDLLNLLDYGKSIWFYVCTLGYAVLYVVTYNFFE